MMTLTVLFWIRFRVMVNQRKNLGNSNPTKRLGARNKRENKSQDSIDVDMVILDQIDQKDQVPQSLGDAVPKKLAGGARKYWQDKPEKLSVFKV